MIGLGWQIDSYVSCAIYACRKGAVKCIKTVEWEDTAPIGFAQVYKNFRRPPTAALFETVTEPSKISLSLSNIDRLKILLF